MRRLIVVVFLALALGIGADELSREDAEAYVRYAPLEQVIDDIIMLDRIERAVPVVGFPGVAVVVHDEDVSVVWRGPITVDVAGRLQYEIKPEPVTASGVVPRPPPRWRPFAAGFASGVIGAMALVIAIM